MTKYTIEDTNVGLVLGTIEAESAQQALEKCFADLGGEITGDEHLYDGPQNADPMPFGIVVYPASPEKYRRVL